MLSGGGTNSTSVWREGSRRPGARGAEQFQAGMSVSPWAQTRTPNALRFSRLNILLRRVRWGEAGSEVDCREWTRPPLG